MSPTRSFALAALLATTLLPAGGFAADAAPSAGVPSRATLAKLCSTCAIVRSVVTETRKGKSSGLGIVGSAVAGGAVIARRIDHNSAASERRTPSAGCSLRRAQSATWSSPILPTLK